MKEVTQSRDIDELVAEVGRLRAESAAACRAIANLFDREETESLSASVGWVITLVGNAREGLDGGSAPASELPGLVFHMGQTMVKMGDQRDEARQALAEAKATIATYEAGGSWPADMGPPLQCGTFQAPAKVEPMSGSDLDFNRNPFCPHCGAEEMEAWDISTLIGADIAETECGKCERPYRVIRHRGFTDCKYSTAKMPKEGER